MQPLVLLFVPGGGSWLLVQTPSVLPDRGDLSLLNPWEQGDHFEDTAPKETVVSLGTREPRQIGTAVVLAPTLSHPRPSWEDTLNPGARNPKAALSGATDQ